MKAYESSAKITSKGLEIPDWLLEILPSNQEVKVIILINEQTDHSEQAYWSKLTAEQFLNGYEQSDAIYDNI